MVGGRRLEGSFEYFDDPKARRLKGSGLKREATRGIAWGQKAAAQEEDLLRGEGRRPEADGSFDHFDGPKARGLEGSAAQE